MRTSATTGNKNTAHGTPTSFNTMAMYTDNRTNALRFSLRDWPAIGKASSKREGSTRTEGSVDQKGGGEDEEDDEDEDEDAGMGSTNK